MSDLVVEREDVPARVSGLDVEEPDVQALQDVRVLELGVGGPDGALQYASQVVRVQVGRRLTQLFVK